MSLSNLSQPILQLKKKEERRIKNGHLWIYSNEIDTAITPLKNMTPGQAVDIRDSGNTFVGRGYVNPNTLLCARILTYNAAQIIDASFFESKITQALSVRERYFPSPYYRLIYGEGDGLPGLIVDRYGDTLSAQLTTAGMELHKEIIAAALMKILQPKTLIWRNDHSMRATEGLDSYVETAHGTADDKTLIIENGVSFLVPVREGQKTGWFFDHGDNRRRMIPFIKNQRVLDVFSYLGAWSIQALVNGAREAWAIDSSASALEISQENAKLNQVDSQFHCLKGDAFQQLKMLHQNGERFDVICLDPPAFIKRRKDHKEGFLAYQRINELAMKLLTKTGLLITSSCSLHLSRAELVHAINVANSADQSFKGTSQILIQGHQNIDHPIHPMIPETNYLKTFFVNRYE